MLLIKFYRNISAIFLVIIILYSFSYISGYSTKNEYENMEFLEGIIILNDTDWNNYTFLGNGTEVEPFRIEGVDINENYEKDLGIFVLNTSKYFIISNCYIDNILILGISNGRGCISNNVFVKNWGESSSFFSGLYIENSPTTEIVDNSFLTGESMIVSNSDNCSISANSYMDSEFGLDLSFSNSSQITQNTFSNSGVWINEFGADKFSTYFFDQNIVNGKPLGFFVDLSDIILSESYGQLIIIQSQNVRILNQNIQRGNIGIALISSKNCIIENSLVADESHFGILILNTSHCTFENMELLHNNVGMFFDKSQSNEISHSLIERNDVGLIFGKVNSSTITYNTFKENKNYAIELRKHSSLNFIHNNEFINNNLDGISQASDDGQMNYWYNIIVPEGNYWSDWTGGNYSIDGTAKVNDSYPLTKKVTQSTSKTDLNLLFTFPAFLLLLVFFKKKKKKKLIF